MRLALVLALVGRAAALNCEGMRLIARQALVNEGPDEETALAEDERSAADSVPDVDLECFGVQPTSLDDAAAMKRHPEGDLAYASVEEVRRLALGSLKKSAIGSRYRRWPSGKVAYTLSSRYSDYSRSVISKAMGDIEKASCVSFTPRSAHRDYVHLFPGRGCYSYVGRTGGKQEISLDAGCISRGTIVHELLHALGFFHEQSRPDRDGFVEVVWENLEGWSAGLPLEFQSSEVVNQFAKYPRTQMAELNVGYDYGSVLHYGPFAYAKPGRGRTLLGKKPGSEAMGQRRRMSAMDQQKLNRLYKCPSKGPDGGAGGEVLPKPVVPVSLQCRNSFQGLCDVWSWLSRNSKCRSGLARRFCKQMCGLC